MNEGQYAQAIPYAERAYNASMKKFGRLHKTTNTLAMNFGTITLFAGNFEDARPLLRRALKNSETIYGENAANNVDPLIRLAQALGTTHDKEAQWKVERNMKDASELYGRAVEIAQPVIGSEAVAGIEIEAAMVFARSPFGYEYGLEIAKQADEHLKNSQNVEARARAKLWVGILSSRMEDPETAEKVLSEALNLPGSEQISVQTKRAIHVALVRYYESQEDSEKATPHVKALSTLSPTVGRSLSQISPIYWTYPDWKSLKRLPSKQVGVVVEFAIDEDGFIKDAKVVESAGEDADTVVLASINNWRYVLPSNDGKIEPIEMVRYEFKIPGRGKARQLGTKISGLDPIRGVSDSAPIGDVLQGGLRSGG